MASKCSAGRYRDTEGAASDEDCTECPEGYYCPNEGQVRFIVEVILGLGDRLILT